MSARGLGQAASTSALRRMGTSRHCLQGYFLCLFYAFHWNRTKMYTIPMPVLLQILFNIFSINNPMLRILQRLCKDSGSGNQFPRKASVIDLIDTTCGTSGLQARTLDFFLPDQFHSIRNCFAHNNMDDTPSSITRNQKEKEGRNDKTSIVIEKGGINHSVVKKTFTLLQLLRFHREHPWAGSSLQHSCGRAWK